MERDQFLKVRQRQTAFENHSLAKQKYMADNFCLLLDIIVPECPARSQLIIISAKGMTHERQKHTLLMLPHVDHFVDEKTLQVQISGAEILAKFSTMRVEPQISVRRHGDVSGLKRPPFPVEYPDRCIIYGVAKDRFAQFNFGS